VIGDDEVEAEAARSFSFGEGAHSGVDGDNDADAFGVGRFKDAGLHAVAIAQAMWDVKADEIASRSGELGAGQHFNGGFEQDDGYGAVDVVIAVEKDGLACSDSAFEPVNCGGHSKHEKGIVEVRGIGIKKGEGVSGGGDAARDEQFREDEGQTGFAGEGSG
jgi:hypothetical protein